MPSYTAIQLKRSFIKQKKMKQLSDVQISQIHEKDDYVKNGEICMTSKSYKRQNVDRESVIYYASNISDAACLLILSVLLPSPFYSCLKLRMFTILFHTQNVLLRIRTQLVKILNRRHFGFLKKNSACWSTYYIPFIS